MTPDLAKCIMILNSKTCKKRRKKLKLIPDFQECSLIKDLKLLVKQINMEGNYKQKMIKKIKKWMNTII